MALSYRPRSFLPTLEITCRLQTLQLRTEIVQVRLRSRHVARQLSTLAGQPGRGEARVLSGRSLGVLRAGKPLGAIWGVGGAGAPGSRRWFASERPGDVPGAAKATPAPSPSTTSPTNPPKEENRDLHESPYTIPNALTISRLLACPILGWTIVEGHMGWATGLLFASGVTDWLDGWLARRYNSFSVLGSILDPMADKALMTTLVVTLAWSGLLPVPLAVLIFGRDFALSMSAFYFRYISLPKPRTLKRYFDPSMPSAEVKPTQISKINTLLQLLLMGLTTVSPLLPFSVALPLQCLQWTVAGTTIWSGLSYVGKAGVNILKQPTKGL
ncbi:CDP-diacylglycerol-glycerol-3-phosphate 3-phosphatidyltransferase [Cryptococcus sp. DSM 104549]